MGLPFVYVRPEPKKHGRQNQIEGFFEKGQSVVVIEDLISTGGSSLQAVAALKAAGAVIKGMAAIFTYDFDVSNTSFAEAKIDLSTLSDYPNLLKEAVNRRYINDDEIAALENWSKSPSDWHAL
jgi:orotate phosphoribosyltransferase